MACINKLSVYFRKVYKPILFCSAIGSFKQCLQLVRLPHGDSCPDNHFWNSLGQHTDFTKRIADGFDPPTCLSRLHTLQIRDV